MAGASKNHIEQDKVFAASADFDLRMLVTLVILPKSPWPSLSTHAGEEWNIFFDAHERTAIGLQRSSRSWTREG